MRLRFGIVSTQALRCNGVRRIFDSSRCTNSAFAQDVRCLVAAVCQAESTRPVGMAPNDCALFCLRGLMLVVLQEHISPRRGEAAGGPVTEPCVRPLRPVLQYSVRTHYVLRPVSQADASKGIIALIAQRFRLNLST